MSHNTEAADAALEFVKHLITLSSGMVAISATFVSHFSSAPRWSLIILAAGWLLLTASVVGGLNAISSIVMSRLHSNDDWADHPGKAWARLSRWGFVSGLVAFALFASVVLLNLPSVLPISD
jgi:hypothetical protein